MAVKKKSPLLFGTLSKLIGMSAIAGLLVGVSLAPAIALTGVTANTSIGVFGSLPEYLEIDQLAQPTTIFAKNAEDQDVVLATFYSQNRIPVSLEAASAWAKYAVISSEDPRFFSHNGVDFIGTTRAMLATVTQSTVQGGSTITQQYVKNVLLQKCELMPQTQEEDLDKYEQCVKEATGTTIERKVREMRYALGVEKKYSKEQILEGYLNIAPFGGSIYGIESAARYYFNIPASELSPAQAASLIAMVNAPNALRIDIPTSESNGAENGYQKNRERRDYILQKMYEHETLSREELDAALATPIEPVITPTIRGCQTAGGAAFFCDYVQKIVLNDPSFGEDEAARLSNFNRGGYRIHTTLDIELQQFSEQTLSTWIPQTYGEINLGGALVGVEPATGRVLYMTQNKNYTQDPEVSANAPEYTSVNYNTDYEYGGSSGFQVGSTYKVFTLAEWLTQNRSLNDTVNASVRTYSTPNNWPFQNSCGDAGSGTWRVTNDDGSNPGNMTPLTATIGSVNTAFVAMARELDLCNIKRQAESFHVHSATGEPLGSTAASVLGTNTIAPLTMATAFAGIANGGVSCTPIAIDKIFGADGNEIAPPKSTCTQSVSPDVAASMAYALNRVTTQGTASGLNTTAHPMLAKTGTTDGNEHIWLVASTTKVASAYWAGNVSGQTSMRAISPTNGTTVANGRTPLMRSMMSTAATKLGGDPFMNAAERQPTQITVPNVIGKTVAQAQSILENAGLAAMNNEPNPQELVTATTPAAGASVTRGSSVGLITNNAPDPNPPDPNANIPIPNVIGKKFSDARNQLSSFALRVVGQITDSATVRSIDPPPGTELPFGTQITVTLSTAG